jgi:hypothetical protein
LLDQAFLGDPEPEQEHEGQQTDYPDGKAKGTKEFSYFFEHILKLLQY